MTPNTQTNIKDHPVMQQILKDSFGGVMYNVANRDKYDTKNLLEVWDKMTPQQQDAENGCITGAIKFILED